MHTTVVYNTLYCTVCTIKISKLKQLTTITLLNPVWIFKCIFLLHFYSISDVINTTLNRKYFS